MPFGVKSGRGFRLDVLIIGGTLFFLNGVFLGVWVIEEAACGIRIVEEFNGGWRYWRYR